MNRPLTSQNLSDLHALTSVLIRAGKPEEILAGMERFLQPWPQVEQILLVILDTETGTLSILPARSEQPPPFLSALLAWLQSADPHFVLLPDLEKASITHHLRAQLLSADLRSLAVIPLLSDAGCLGYLLLGSSVVDPVDEATWQWLQLAAAPIGPVLHRIQCEREIAARVEAEAALRESEMRYRELYENAPNAYFSVSNDGRIYSVNRQAEKLTGYTAAELIGRAVTDIHVDSSGAVSAQSTFDEFLVGTEIREREMQLRRADGSTVWIDLTVTPISDATGAVIASRSVAVDISERRALQEMRQAFVDMIVHDLRHPLGVIAGSADMLESEIEAENDSAREFLAFIQTSARQALSLIQNILNVHRLEQKQMPVAIQSVAADAVIQDVLQEFSVHLAQQHIELVLQLSDNLPRIQGDPDLLKRVLQNLLDNAIKVTADGGTIEIAAQPHTEKGDDGVRVAVIDHGPGISAEGQARLFQLFSRGSISGGGYGVGLAFCKVAMEAMEGRIWLESVLGQGTTFLLFLPVAA